MLTSPPPSASDSRAVAAKANAQVVQRDSHLLGLASLLEPQSLSSSITDLLGAGDVVDVRLSYLRYKPHRRCIALLDVTTDDRSELVIATALTKDSWLNWQRKPICNSNASNVLHIDDCRLVLERFPYDRQLRHIAKLYDEESRHRLLRRILPPDAGHLRQRGANVQVQRLAYKPARRLVVGIGADDGVVDGSQFTVKFHSKSAFYAAARRMQSARALSLPDFMETHCCERYQAVATSWVPGQNLSELNNCNSGVPAPTVLREVGRKLAELHSWQLPPGNELSVTGSAKTAAELRLLAEDLAFLYPPLASDVRRVIQAAAENVPSDDALTLIHGDFYAKQVIVQDESIRFIDLDELSVGNPWQDVGNFVAKLHWNHVRGQLPDERLQSAIEFFLAGYREGRGWNERDFRCYLAIGLLKSMPHTFRLAADNWPALFARLLELAANAPSSRSSISTSSTTSLSNVLDDPSFATDHVRCALQHATTRLEFPLTQLHFLDAHSLRLKPDRRCLLECRFVRDLSPNRISSDKADEDLLQVLGKVRFKGLDCRTPELHQKLQAAGFQDQSLVRVPRYLGVVPSMNMWLQEKIHANAVTPDFRTPLETHANVAQALAAFHSSGVCVDRSHTIDDELTILTQRLQDVSLQQGEWREQIEVVLKQCTALATELPRTKACLIHRDFYFEQVLCDGSQISLLDLDLATMGSAELDTGNYIAHLLEFGIRSPENAEYCHRAAAIFAEAYADSNAATQPSAIAAWTTLSLARHIWISTLFNNRRHTTRRLLKTLIERRAVLFESRS